MVKVYWGTGKADKLLELEPWCWSICRGLPFITAAGAELPPGSEILDEQENKEEDRKEGE